MGNAFVAIDWVTLLIAFFLGPVWVMRASPTSPRNDGPPRGGIVPFPMRTPGGDDTLDGGRDRTDRAARVALHMPITRVWLPRRRVISRTT
jgi:hypothetical protein